MALELNLNRLQYSHMNDREGAKFGGRVGGGARCILSGWRVSSTFQAVTDTRELKPPTQYARSLSYFNIIPRGVIVRSHLSWYSI